MLVKEQLIKNIVENVAFYSESVSMENAIGFFDSNRSAQDFLSGLFRLVFDYKNLVELDKLNDTVTYPAIDLGDLSAKVAFQITTRKDSKKVQDTIDKFVANELYHVYNRLIFYVFGTKQAKYSNFDTKSKLDFNVERDIWDNSDLIKAINKLEISKLRRVQEYLEENLGELKLPEILFPRDIKKCIEILRNKFGNEGILRDTLGQRADGEFIKNVKNPLNKVSWDFFNAKIRGHVIYNENIIEFLSDPINEDVKIQYLEISQSIQDFYKDPSNNFSSFESVFVAIFDKINTYNEETSGISTKLKIILHNMYFNCDIGDNYDDD